MINIYQTRIINKLDLWNTPGFLQFIQDLHDSLAPEVNVKAQVEVLRRIYNSELKKLQPKPKFKQTKMEL